MMEREKETWFRYWDAEKKELVYHHPLSESWQGLPLGTGKTGIMAWCSPGKLLDLQLTRGDTWAPDLSLPSLLRLSIKAKDGATGDCFTGKLQPGKGKVVFFYSQAGLDEPLLEVHIFAHRQQDAFEVLLIDKRRCPGPIEVIPTFWRNGVEPQVEADTIFFTEENRFSATAFLNRESGIDHEKDPVAPLLYGSVVSSDKGTSRGPLTPALLLPPSREHRIVIAGRCCSSTISSPEKHCRSLQEDLRRVAGAVLRVETEVLQKVNLHFWNEFFSRSYIEVPAQSPLQKLAATWYLNRYFAASTMEGTFPPKFNGSLFLFEYDRRYWGGAYWFQNSRLLYWPLLKSGDGHYGKRFFRIYLDLLPVMRDRCKKLYGHDGVIFPETMHFTGAARAGDASGGHLSNPYIQSYFGGSLELIFLMLEWLDYQEGDEDITPEEIFSLGFEVVQFFISHFSVKDGKLFLENSAALETWWEVDQPADQIAGLRAVVPRLIQLGRRLKKQDRADKRRIETGLELLQRAESILPDLPRGEITYDRSSGTLVAVKEGDRFIPALRFHHPRKENFEDPELYALWPYRLIGKGREEYPAAVETFHHRIHKEPCYGWSQTGIWAARLGLAEEAARLLLEHFDQSARFPGGMFASPGYTLGEDDSLTDCPYFDPPGSLATGLQEMLLRDDPELEEPELLPGWPKEEPVRFRLYSRTGWVELDYKGE